MQQQNSPNADDNKSLDGDAVRAVIDDCLRRRSAGEAISDETILAAHPELMPALGEELRRLRVIAAARQRAAVSSDEDGDTRSHRDAASGSGRLEVRCPNCHEPTEVAVDTPLTDLTCSACGSHFSLVDQSKATRMAPSLSKMGRFELVERIGIGGFGSVWKARDKELDRTVAIKIPRRGDMTAEEQEKFFREARAAAQLRHPSIVSVHEVGRDGDSVYIVSDYVRGVTLGDWLTGQQLTSREAAELCAKIADALHHAHEKGIVHRDLKPANIMMDYDGQPHLMDFGLARREVGEVTVTIDGQVLGTPAYMSPEQAQGEGHTADRRSDVYSLGVILFQLLTGEMPFRGNARMLIKQVIQDEPPSPRKLNANVPRDLETVTLKCLEKDPAKRFQSACELSEELRRYLSGEPIHARPISRTARAWRWAQRRPAVAALIAMLAGVAVIGPIIAVQQAALRAEKGTLLADRERTLAEKSKALTDMRIADEERERAFVRRDEALKQLQLKNEELKSQFARNLIDRAAAECDRGRIEQGIALLASADARLAAGDPLHTSARNLMAAWADGRGLPVIVDGDVTHVVFSPDGRTVLIVTGEPSMLLWDVETGQVAGDPIYPDFIVDSVVFTDGTTVLTARSGDLQAWNVRTGKPLGDMISIGQDVEAAAFSRDAQSEIILEHSVVRRHDVKTGRLLRAPVRLAENVDVALLALSPDDRTLLIANGNSARLWNADSGQAIGHPMDHDGEIHAVGFSADGQKVLTGSADRTARLWDASSGKLLETQIYGAEVHSVTMSVDGQRIITGSADGAVEQHVVGFGKPGHPLQHSGSVDAVAISPDGLRIVSGSSDETARIWNSETNQPSSDVFRHDDRVTLVALSPDGRRAVTTGYDLVAKLWHKDAEWKSEDLFHDEAYVGFALSPDGRTLVTATMEDWGYGRIRNAETGVPFGEQLLHANYPVAFSPDGRMIVTGLEILYARVWDAGTGKPLGEPMHHSASIRDVAFSQDGQRVLTGSGNVARLWDAATGKPLGKSMRHDPDVLGVAFSPDGATVLTGSLDKTARIWDANSGQQIGEPLRLDEPISVVAFSPDGKTVATGSYGKTARLWNVKTREPIGEVLSHGDGVNDMAFSPDGHTLLTACHDASVRLWDARTGKPIDELPRHDGSVSRASFRSDSRTILTVSSIPTARVWDCKSGKLLGVPLNHYPEIQDVVLSADGDKIIVSGGHTARIWDVKTGEPIGRPLQHDDDICAVAVSPDGRFIATGSADKSARLWDLSDGTPVTEPSRHGETVYAVDFGSDGSTLLTVSALGWVHDQPASLHQWDARSGKPRGTPLNFVIHGRENQVVFSPDRQKVLLGFELWDVTKQKKIEHFKLKSLPDCAAFSPDSRMLLAVDQWYNALLWDTESGKQLLEPIRHDREVRVCAFSPDGSTIVTGDKDGMARRWDVHTGNPLGKPLPCKEPVDLFAFSPEGDSLRIASMANPMARLWNLPQLPAIEPKQVAIWAKTQTGFDLDEQGVLQRLTHDEFVAAQQQLSRGIESPDATVPVVDNEADDEASDEAVFQPTVSELRTKIGQEQMVELSVENVRIDAGRVFLDAGPKTVRGGEGGFFSVPDAANDSGTLLLAQFGGGGGLGGGRPKRAEDFDFTVVIDGPQVALLFDSGIESAQELLGRRLRVTGKIEDRDGKLQIEVTDIFQQLELRSLLGEWFVPEKLREIPGGFVKPTVAELRKLIGTQQTVEFQVQQVGGITRRYLNSSAINYRHPDCFAVVIEAEQVAALAILGLDDPDRELQGKTLRVTGKIDDPRDGGIIIRANDVATQLKIVEPQEAVAPNQKP